MHQPGSFARILQMKGVGITHGVSMPGPIDRELVAEEARACVRRGWQDYPRAGPTRLIHIDLKIPF
jgi:hypothetical protein